MEEDNLELSRKLIREIEWLKDEVAWLKDHVHAAMNDFQTLALGIDRITYEELSDVARTIIANNAATQMEIALESNHEIDNSSSN